MEPIRIDLPLCISIGVNKPKNIYLNLNVYRNAHFQQLNNIKVLFERIIKPKLINVPYMEKVSLIYKVYYPTKIAIDISNICSIVDKFFCDTLTSAGKIPDDNMEVISSISYQWGGVDKLNPRVEVTLKEVKPMQITTVIKLNDDDISNAVRDYVIAHFPSREDTEYTISLGYYEGSFSAEVTVGAAASIGSKPEPKKRGRPPAQPEQTIIPLPEKDDLTAATEYMQEADTIINDEPSPVAQEAPVDRSIPEGTLFPVDGKAASVGLPMAAMESKPDVPNTKSLFNLKALTQPKN